MGLHVAPTLEKRGLQLLLHVQHIMQGEVAAVNILESVSGQQTGESDAVNINYNWSLAKLHVYAVSE